MTGGKVIAFRAGSSRWESIIRLLSAFLVIAAAAVRIAGVNNQLWLDEIWSIRLAQTAGSPLGIFTLHHDNNHWLNTLVLYFLGPGRPFWAYHLIPEICGIGTVVLGWLLARRSMAALILLSASEFLIEFSSDARGYAPAGFFVMLCWWLFQEHLRRPRRGTAVLMSASAVLGILSHLTFVVILAGLFAASIVATARPAMRPAAVIRATIWWAMPVAAVILLYLIDVRHMERGGGPTTAEDLPAQSAAMILGLPQGSVAAPLFGAIAMLICAVQLWRRFKVGDPAWPLLLAALLFVPALLFLWPRNDYIHPRYIYVAAPLLLVLLGTELQKWLSGRWMGKALAVILLVGYCVANAIPLTTFLRLGRGDYRGALNYMIAHNNGPNLIVATLDRHPLSTLMVLEYYKQYHTDSRLRVMTLRDGPWGDQWPQWLMNEFDSGAGVATANGVPFVRRGIYPTGAVTSGITWAIYEAGPGRSRVRPENLQPILP